MPLRDHRAVMPLTHRELAVLAALREQSVSGADGLSWPDVARIGDTRWPERVIRALRSAGYVIGEDQGQLFLVHEPAEAA
jgi:hypothetical protein